MIPIRTPRPLLPALLLAACGGGPDGAPPDRPDVLLVVVDTLRRDHLGCYGHPRDTSPHVDRLAERGVRYGNAVSQAPWTTPSVGALLTSRYPSTLGIHTERSTLGEEHELLSETLRDAGYVTGAVVSHSFCSSRWGFAQGFDHFDESNVLGHAAVTSEGVTDRALEFLDAHEGGNAPWFLWVHYFDPHCAYVEHDEHDFGGPSGYRGPVTSGQLFAELQDLRSELGTEDARELERLYDSEIAFTDRQIGRLLDRLEAGGGIGDDLIVLTADHGEEFLDHGRLGHAKTLYEEVIGVPLIVHYPGGPSGVVEPDLVGLIDVHPTVLDVVGLPVPEDAAGHSFAPGAALPPDRVLFAEAVRRRAMSAAVSRSHKLVRRWKAGESELYDRIEDPAEQHDLANRVVAERERLAAALERFRVEVQEGGASAPEIELDAGEAGRLDELGYGGGDD